MKALSIVSLLLISNISYAEADDKEEMLNLADEFAYCVGTLKSASKDLAKKEGTKDSVALLDGAARGAQIASQYILSSVHSDGKKPMSEYKAYVDSIAYTYETKMDALYEINDSESQALINSSINTCAALNPLQAKIIQEWRKQTHLPK